MGHENISRADLPNGVGSFGRPPSRFNSLAPTRAEVDKNIQQNRDLLRKLGKLGPEAPATAGTPALTAASDRDMPGTTLLSRSWGWSSSCGMACATRGG